MKKILALLFIISSSIQADIALSSPKVSVNEQGQFLMVILKLSFLKLQAHLQERP